MVLVYDITSRDSFRSMERWFEEAETNAIPGAVMYLVGSKLDKASSRTVSYEEGDTLAQAHGCSFCEVSAKTRENVRKPFIDVVEQIVNSPDLLHQPSRRPGVQLAGQTNAGSICSC